MYIIGHLCSIAFWNIVTRSRVVNERFYDKRITFSNGFFCYLPIFKGEFGKSFIKFLTGKLLARAIIIYHYFCQWYFTFSVNTLAISHNIIFKIIFIFPKINLLPNSIKQTFWGKLINSQINLFSFYSNFFFSIC